MQGRQNLRTWDLLGIIRAPDVDGESRRQALEQAASRLLGYLALATAAVAVIWVGLTMI